METHPHPLDIEALEARGMCLASLEPGERAAVRDGRPLVSIFDTEAEVRRWAFATGLCTPEQFDANPAPYFAAHRREQARQRPPRAHRWHEGRIR